jgi:hypothetical protein
MGMSSFGALFGILAKEGVGHEIVLKGDKDLQAKERGR